MLLESQLQAAAAAAATTVASKAALWCNRYGHEPECPYNRVTSQIVAPLAAKWLRRVSLGEMHIKERQKDFSFNMMKEKLKKKLHLDVERD